MRLVVGLGNPGKDYAKSKHNIGFMILDSYAMLKGLKFKKETKFQGEWIKFQDTILLKPKTYMNNSGISVQTVMKFFQINPNDILVISDDLDLPFGKVRLREKGSAGGHNGLKSIIALVGTQNFCRMRFGIDRDDNEVVDYVLSKLTKDQSKQLKDLLITTNGIIDDFVLGKTFDSIMNTYNK